MSADTTTRNTQEILTGLLSQLIRMPTVTRDTATNAAALDWIEEHLTTSGLGVTRYVNHSHPCLVALSPGNTDPKNPRLWLVGHVDVVPAPAEQFEPHIENGRLSGRGAFDMKYGLAVYIALMQELAPALADYDLGIILTSDEELGGPYGANWLVNELGYRGGAVFLPECGTSWTLETGAKGMSEWKIESRGRASHGSRPWDGVNAIDQLNRFIGEIKSHCPVEPCKRPQHNHPTVNIGRFAGGAVSNQVADKAEALLDIRVPPDLSLQTVRAWFQEAETKVPGVKAHLLTENSAYNNVLEGPAGLFRTLAEDITKRPLKPMLSYGASDGRFFAAHDIPVISVPPTGGGQHSAEEWIDLKNLGLYYGIIRRFVDEWAKTKA